MTIFSVQHTTTYRYKNPVKPGRHQLMFRPRDSFDQRLLECNLKISPPPSEIRWIHDAFGNCITLVDFSSATTVFHFDTFIMLAITRKTRRIFVSKTMHGPTRSPTPRTSYPTWLPISGSTTEGMRALSNGLPNSSTSQRARRPASC